MIHSHSSQSIATHEDFGEIIEYLYGKCQQKNKLTIMQDWEAKQNRSDGRPLEQVSIGVHLTYHYEHPISRREPDIYNSALTNGSFPELSLLLPLPQDCSGFLFDHGILNDTANNTICFQDLLHQFHRASLLISLI